MASRSGQEKSHRTAIVVLNFNGLDDTLKCLESLRGVTVAADVILVDNASAIDPTAPSLQCYPGIDVIRTAQNLGYAGGNNRGIERALATGAEFVLVLNNDTIVDPRLVERLVEAFDSSPALGVAGPVINYMDEPDQVMTDGVRFNPGPGTEFFRRIEVPLDATKAPTPVDIVNGCCLMVRAEVFRRVGLFDEDLFIVHEESDLCLRARLAGFDCAVVPEVLVWHKGSSAFERSGRQLQRYFDARNLYYLLRRYSGRLSGTRSLARSLAHFFLYAYYRAEVEREHGQSAARTAVAEGVADALASVRGPYVRRRRPLLPLVNGMFAAARAVARIESRLRRVNGTPASDSRSTIDSTTRT
jgi:GT2 family glycosyltransferase